MHQIFTTCKEEGPVIAQISGNDPDLILKGCRFLEKECSAIDLNLGCPQNIARKGIYGAFLLEEEDLVM